MRKMFTGNSMKMHIKCIIQNNVRKNIQHILLGYLKIDEYFENINKFEGNLTCAYICEDVCGIFLQYSNQNKRLMHEK